MLQPIASHDPLQTTVYPNLRRQTLQKPSMLLVLLNKTGPPPGLVDSPNSGRFCTILSVTSRELPAIYFV